MTDKMSWQVCAFAVLCLIVVYSFMCQWVVINGQVIPVEIVKYDPPMDNSIGNMESNQRVYFAHDYLAGKNIKQLSVNDEFTIIRGVKVSHYRVTDVVFYNRGVSQALAYDNFSDVILQTCEGMKIMIVRAKETK